ncbi:hypothetical protein G7Y89_g13700 [Cudoniella acicularis]|uniref:Uncharacterized protein n=1 Tax=Cudoniella acicularis TaxID=354080 RepID=A0A8H4R6E2_9HELO|nr:hypothetical protein G7Y89_g13700 [Cudoniella acicularis]
MALPIIPPRYMYHLPTSQLVTRIERSSLQDACKKPYHTVKRNYADTTADNLQGIIDKFSRFCVQMDQDWRIVIRDCKKGATIAFLIHICEVDRVKKRSSIYQYYLQFKMLFNRENGRHMDTNDIKEALAYIYGKLTTDFELDITVREKPVLGFPLILLFLFATGCRPAELVDVKRRRRQRPGLDDDETCADDMNDEGFGDAEVGADADFGFDDDHDSTVADLGSENDDDDLDDDVAMSGVDVELRQFDALYYYNRRTA